MSSTAGTIIGIAEGITKISSSSIGLSGLSTDSLLQIIDKAVREFFNKQLLSGGENKLLQAEYGTDLVAETALAEDITSSTTDFDVDSASNFPSSGAFVIFDNGMDIGEYTGKSSNNLTGVSGLGYSHETDDIVAKIYPLPSNFGSFRSTERAKDGVLLDNVSQTYVEGEPYPGQFTMYDNGTTKYLIFPQGSSGKLHVTYNKKVTTIDEATDTIEVPVDDEDFVVYRLVEHIYRVLGLLDKVADARSMASSSLISSLKRRNVGKRLRLGRSVRINSEYIPTNLFP